MPDTYVFIIVAMGLVTYIPRLLPLFVLTKYTLPAWFKEWLALIPASVLSALLLPALVTEGDPRYLDILRPELWVAVPTLIIALATKSLGGTVVVGMGLFWLSGKIF
ncbi:MAG: AzlD domain-containing protein [Deltaproteobacteria bacterium]|jgi:branched-subunit amino acid transport protein|nr:AzlD domain-containing protein [Deltaproteobacteria bacterium]